MRIVMLSQNEWRHDSRVIREAEALARIGHDVHVVCRRAPGAETVVEEAGGVVYHEIPIVTHETMGSLTRLGLAHARVLWLQAKPGPDSLGGVARLAGLVVSAPLLGSLMLTRRLVQSEVYRSGLARTRVDSLLRRAPRLRAAVLRSYVEGVIEATRYLDDCARACVDTVVALSPDVIHVHDLIALSGGAVAARSAGAKLVYDAHELETHTNYHLLSPVTKRAIERYESSLIARCDSVVTVCDSIADWLRDTYRIARPIVVMNAPRRASSRQATETLRQVLGIERSVPLIVYVGSVTVDRGLELTVEALADLPETHFATVGPRYEVTEQAMRLTAERLGVSDRVHFVNPVPSSEVVSFIADADASVIPIQNVCLSYAFCFPNKLLESVFAGLPVVAADLVELRRFLEENPVGVLMDEREPSAIASAIAEVVRRRHELAPDAEAISRIDERYGWETQELRLFALYERLGSRRSNHARAAEPTHSQLAS